MLLITTGFSSLCFLFLILFLSCLLFESVDAFKNCILNESSTITSLLPTSHPPFVLVVNSPLSPAVDSGRGRESNAPWGQGLVFPCLPTPSDGPTPKHIWAAQIVFHLNVTSLMDTESKENVAKRKWSGHSTCSRYF